MALYRYRTNESNWEYFEEVHFFFESFYIYVNETNNLIEKEIKLARKSYDKFLKKYKENPHLSHIDYELYSDLKIREGLTEIYYDSLIITLYSFVEKKMLSLCKSLSKNKVIKANDIAGKGIYKFQKYLSKVCNIDFKPIEEEWRQLDGYNKLRNHLVHSEGNRSIPVENKGLKNFLKSCTGVNTDEKEGVLTFRFISDDILVDFTAIAKTIIDYLYIEKV